VVKPFVPDRGDIVWLEFDPQSGHEQAGRRPAIVLSPRNYNERAGLMLCCPVTSKIKGYPFEVALPANLRITGVVLTDQLRNLDWKARRASFIDHLPDEAIAEILRMSAKLLA
jgi:mRNA interferase MazF